MGKMIGVIVAIGIAVFALWLLVDMAWYLWGGMAALIFVFLLIFLVVYLVDRRKIKESEDLFAS